MTTRLVLVGIPRFARNLIACNSGKLGQQRVHLNLRSEVQYGPS